MTAVIAPNKCNSCGGAREPLCVRICPGDLFYQKEDGRVALRNREECWDCAACVKVCRQQALALMLPVEAGGRGAQLHVEKTNKGLYWNIK